MRTKRITALLLVMVLFMGTALAQNITWHNAGEKVVPAGNTLAYTIQKAFMGESGGQTYLLMAVEVQAGEAGADLALKDFVAMTKQDDVFYPLYAQSADKAVTVTEEAPLVISAYGIQALTFVFPVSEGMTDFILVYRNAPGGDFYATNASFGGQSESTGGITIGDDAAYSGVPPALKASRDADSTSSAKQSGSADSGAAQSGKTMECLICHGDGECSYCGGDGESLGWKCDLCAGGGICQSCKGTGVWDLGAPKKYPDGVCQICGSNGICQICLGRGEFYVPSYGTSESSIYSECAGCNGSGDCDYCDGTGKE